MIDEAGGNRKLLPDREVCKRYGVVPRTLRRWDDNPSLEFPPPTFINGRKYRDEAKLDAWDREQAIKGRAA